MKSPEGYEKDDIEKYLKSIGCWYIRTFTGGFGKSGVPDFVGCYRGRFFSIEVKREGKGPTKLQFMRMQEIKDAHGFAWAGTAAIVIPKIEAWKNNETWFK